MKNITILLSVFLISTTAVASGEFELKGVKIGDSARTLDYGAFRCSETSRENYSSECISLEHVTIANKDALITLTIYEYKVDSIMAFFAQEDFQDIKDAILIKYGKPSNQLTNTLTNSFGAKFSSLEISWRKKNITALLRERVGDIESSVLSIYSDAHVKRSSEKKKIKNEENSKDI